MILLALGLRFVFFKLKEEPPQSQDTRPARFWVGFSISALNPTLLATWGAVTTFIYSKELVQLTPILAIPFGVFAAAGIALWGLMMVTLLKRYRSRLPKKLLTWTVRVMGLVLIGVAVWSGVELARYIVVPGSRHRAAVKISAVPPSRGEEVLTVRPDRRRSRGRG